MPRNHAIKNVLVIGSGPIIIGQGAEFDYAGTQACRVLKEEGVEIILVNSNPATIMTDQIKADKIYIEPLTIETLRRIIIKEDVDSILSGFGGQTGLTLCMQLAKEGFLEANEVTLLGSSYEVILKAEDRELFKQTMESIHQPIIPSVIAEKLEEALAFADEMGYPLIIRPAFTLGGSGGGIANNKEELSRIASYGLSLSPIHQILVECSIAGWKEIEFEVMRDHNDNAICVCSMENFDPVGVHTGDSIVVAPTLTLADKEYQMLRKAALAIIHTLQVEGGCNVQFALHPDSYDYAVIEVNPRVSRSSALASKATGYPIAKVATKIALGYTLDEIINDITKKTYASFEPALDYIVVKFPKFPFDKFVYAQKELGTQMKATGEVMSIADTFEEALCKAVRGAGIGQKDLSLEKLYGLDDTSLMELLSVPNDERVFQIYEAIQRGISIDELHDITKIDRFFLHKLKNIPRFQKPSDYIYKMVDTCGGEFEAITPYFYSIANGSYEDEAAPLIEKSKKKRIIVLGSGPIRIGQGIEFDYACVHCVMTLKKMGYEVIVINNNPETVSTDFDIADRLYFEPLCFDEVMSIIEKEQPFGVIVSFGGGTAISLAEKLYEHGVNIIGTSADAIDICEDRERFDALLESLHIPRPEGKCAMNKEEALRYANALGYPVLIRPSYVLGGQNMIIAFHNDDVEEYMKIILASHPENPILIDKYLQGREIEVDAICDSTDILIPGIMEHIERTGVHSGDSIAIYPPMHIHEDMCHKIIDTTRRICLALHVKGLLNVQFIIMKDELYIIEVNPRASRTVPYLSKVSEVPICDLATQTSLGMKLKALGYGTGLYPDSKLISAKVPVFSFEKLAGVDTQLGPEMKSTGEVLGIGRNLKEALYKGLLAAGYAMANDGGVLFTVRDQDKHEIAEIAMKFYQLGFTIYATKGSAKVIKHARIPCTVISKIHENKKDNTMTLLESHTLSYVISTSEKGRNPADDDVKIRRKACLLKIPCLTSLDTANAMADALASGYHAMNTYLVNINDMSLPARSLHFTKMQGCGNDYIYVNAWSEDIDSPELIAAKVSDRHFGIGGDGLVLIRRSAIADARMQMFNQDGSEGRMCGNAIRCIAKYLYEHRMVHRQEMAIETHSGIRRLHLHINKDQVTSVTINMGKAIFDPQKIPVRMNMNKIINEAININETLFHITCVSMGNPHAVVFMETLNTLDIHSIGPLFEHHSLFPERVNTEFIEVLDREHLRMRVWERGSGETLACGTGACAAVCAAIENHLVDKDREIHVQALGGELHVLVKDDGVFLRGDCENVFEGSITI